MKNPYISQHNLKQKPQSSLPTTSSRVRHRWCKTAEVQNIRGFCMQQTKRRRTDLACSTNYNTQNKNLYKKNRSVAI